LFVVDGGVVDEVGGSMAVKVDGCVEVEVGVVPEITQTSVIQIILSCLFTKQYFLMLENIHLISSKTEASVFST
jgi:hypothetical protein